MQEGGATVSLMFVERSVALKEKSHEILVSFFDFIQ
jgi:hypothetical protein